MSDPRIDFNPTHYPRIRAWNPDEGLDQQLYLHRLVAYAHGLVDSPFQKHDREIHHKNHDKWDNRPENLRVVERSAHTQYHLNGVDL